MPTIDVLDTDGKAVGEVELPGEVFDAPVKPHVMHQVVTAQQAAARSGTASTRTRGQRRGGGRKPWRQKGTGRARQGSTRAPQWRKGGVVHGPTGEQNHVKRVPRRMRRQALRSALTDRRLAGALRVVRGLERDGEPSTKWAREALGAIDADGRALVVSAVRDEVLTKSLRNLPQVHHITVDQLNTYDVLVSDVVVLAEEAVAWAGTGGRPDLPSDADEGVSA